MLPALISGSIDIGIFMAPYVEGTLPVFSATDLPYVWGDGFTQREGSRKGSPFFKLVSTQCEKKNLKLLAMASSCPEELMAREPLTKLEDFKGMKIRVAGAGYAKAWASIGAVPISMPSSELYTSLQRGVVDAAMGVDITFRARKLYEVAKYQINLNAFLFDWPVIMNKGSFDRLSEEQKKVIWNAAELYRHDFSTAESLGMGYLNMRNILKNNYGIKQIYLSESEKARMKKAMWGPTVKWWKKKIGSELGDKILNAIEESKNWRKSKFGYVELYPLKY
jgi:TRAP-type C4-dicarboxylate transport system substrate-binding protein